LIVYYDPCYTATMKVKLDPDYGALEITDEDGYRLWFNPGTYTKNGCTKTVLAGRGITFHMDEIGKSHHRIPRNWFCAVC
jgi:hypothetical protein